MNCPRLLTCLLLLLLLSNRAPVRAQGGPDSPAAAGPILRETADLDLEQPAVVKVRLQELLAAKAELESAQPVDAARLDIVNERVRILQRHAQFLETRERLRANRIAGDDRVVRAEEEASGAQEERARFEGLTPEERIRDLGLASEEDQQLQTALVDQESKVATARDLAAQTDADLRAAKAEKDQLLADQKTVQERLTELKGRLRDLTQEEEQLRNREDASPEERELARARLQTVDLDRRQRELRQEFLTTQVDPLDRAVALKSHVAARARDELATEEARAGALRAVLEKRLTVRIRRKEADRAAAEEVYRQILLDEELQNLRLDATRTDEKKSAAATTTRLAGLANEDAEAARQLGAYEAKYARGAPGSDRPTSEMVSEEIRRLAEETSTRAYIEELDGFRSRREDLEERLPKLREAQEGSEAKLATALERARKAWVENPPGPGARDPRVSSLADLEVAFEVVRTKRRDLLKDTIATLEQQLAEVDRAIELRTGVHETRRTTLLLLRRENLFLRGESRISWESFTRGLSDLTLLPGWLARAAGDVATYVTDAGHRSSLTTFALLLAILAAALLLLRRRLLARVGFHTATGTEEKTVLRARIVALRLSAALCPTLLLFAGFFGAYLLLSDSIPTGVLRLLPSLGLVLAGFWFGRALNRVLVRGRSEAGRVLPFDEATASRFGVGISVALWLTVVLVPLELLLRELSYSNEGALELLSLLHRVLVGLVVVVVVFRRRYLLGLIPESASRLARFLRVLVTALHPIFVLLVPALLILDVLRYDILAGLIAGVAVNTVSLAVVGYLVYRGAILFADRKMAGPEALDFRAPPSDRKDAREVVQFGIFLACLLGTIWGILAFSGTSLSELRTFFSEPLPFQGADAAAPATWWNLFVALFLLYLAFAVTKHLKKALEIFVLGRTRMDRGLQYTIVTLFGYVLVTTGVVLAARQLFDLTNFGYVVAALSVGIGFGLQEIVSNFISGIILLFERSLKVGDLIEVGNTAGVVTRIQVRSTNVVTRDNITITIPNRDFMTKDVVNFVGADSKVRLHVPVGVSYASDPEVVRRVLLGVAKEEPLVLGYPAPEVWFQGLGDSSLDFELLGWVRDPVEMNRITSHLYFRIFAAFRAAGIEIPFPQRDLHLRSAEPIRFAGPGPGAPPPPPLEEE